MEFQLLLKSNNCDPDQSSSSSTQSNIVKLSKGFKTILGRGSNWGLLDVQLSRKHCCFFVSEDGKHLTLTHVFFFSLISTDLILNLFLSAGYESLFN